MRNEVRASRVSDRAKKRYEKRAHGKKLAMLIVYL
jgi:hypothetical protein